MTTQELTTYTSPLNEDMPLAQLGSALFKSGFFQDTRDANQAIVKILAGREMGIGPIAAMTGINVIKGRVTMSANLIAAQIKRSGRYDYRVLRLDDTGCEIAFYERAGGKATELGHSAFTADDAKAAGLLGGENYKKFPRNMYFSRALTNGARWYTPEVFGGSAIYTPDELIEAEPATYTQPQRTDVNVETGEIIDSNARTAAVAELQRLAVAAKGLGLDTGLAGRKPKEMSDEEIAQASATIAKMLESEYAAIEAPVEATSVA